MPEEMGAKSDRITQKALDSEHRENGIAVLPPIDQSQESVFHFTIRNKA